MSIKNRVTLSGNINSRVNLSENLQNTFLKGVGIADAVLNSDYTLTLLFTDGSSYTTPPIRGAQGEQGIQGETGEAGQDGHSPVITASKAGNVTTVYVDGTAVATISDGADGKDGKDGADGQDGAPGADGKDGVSPSVTVTAITGGHTIAITDATKTVTFTVLDGIDGQDGANGQDGADGHSPVVTASKSGKVTTVSVDGTAIATINDGEDGQNGQDGADGTDGKSAYQYAVDGGYQGTEQEFAQKMADEYVRPTDYATSSDAGVVKVDSTNGIGIESGHKLYIEYAPSNLIKSGTGNYRPITPPRQHEAAFYGLAKAAGDSTQAASSNAVGTYTDDAKTAIKSMLGVPTMSEIITAVHASYASAEEVSF